MTIYEISHTTKHQKKTKLQSFFFHHFLTAEIENTELNVSRFRIGFLPQKFQAAENIWYTVLHCTLQQFFDFTTNSPLLLFQIKKKNLITKSFN